MRKGLFYIMAVSVCLALAFTPVLADRTSDRTKGASRTAASGTDWSATVGDQVLRQNNGPREVQDITTQGKAAEIVAQAASLEGNEAASLLMQVTRMDLPQNDETEKMLGDVYHQLGDLYQGTAHKQVHWYSLAMQYTADPGARSELEQLITSLGGDAFALSANPVGVATREIGYDTCDTAMAVTLPFTTNLSILYWGDHDWFAFDLGGPDGAYVHIWTCHPNPFEDTDLTLYDGCPGTQIAFNDDWFSGPAEPCYPAYFLSSIETGCMAPGTYYVEVGGWLDWSTPQNFDLTIEVTGTCVLPSPDAYEPDDVREDASDIGHPTSIPQHANGWGRAKKEIQSRNIFPVMNSDFIAFKIERNEIVTMETAGQFPTFFNDFTGTTGYFDNPDTYLELYYGIEPNYGGFCNTPTVGWVYWCFSDADCDGLITDPLPIFPDCIPLQFFTVGGAPYWFWENRLAFNDDGGAGFSSLIQACLPRADQQTTSGTAAGDWLVRVWPYWANDIFDYQVMVKNETPCDFEVEPNNDFPFANPLVWGMISGITDQSNFNPNYGDIDLYSFDVDELSIVNFETWGPDPYQSDNAMELYVGPDDYGYYYFTGVQNDDCYAWLSCLEDVILPPADELLGNMYADADYYLNVTTWWLNKNFLYSLFSDVAVAPTYVFEVEPNDTCPGQGVALNDVILGGLHDYYVYGYCDYDSYTFTVTANSYVTMETDGIDTVIALYDGTDYLGCDDDSGTGYIFSSLLEGCLPPGDYCLQVRGYGYWTDGAYDLAITDGGACAPTVPVYLGELGLRCDGGQAEFETCPN